jgi:hypothetical protein
LIYALGMKIEPPIRVPRRSGIMSIQRGSLSALAVGGLIISGCTATRSGTIIPGPHTIDASQAVIMPAPGGPAVVSVIEERFSNGVEHKVILATSASTAGQNALTIRMYGPMERETQGTKSLPYRALTSATLSQEMHAAVPGIAMKTSPFFLRNNYGPFGYAYGRNGAGDSCIYGWQQIRTAEAERSNFRNAGAVQVRLRLCEAGASEKQLLAVMYGYTITGSFSSDQWNPYGSPNSVDKTLGVDGAPIYPSDAELAAAPVVERARPTRRVVRKAVDQSREGVTDPVLEEEKAKRIVDVPSPVSDTDAASIAETPDNDVPVTVPGPVCPEGETCH